MLQAGEARAKCAAAEVAAAEAAQRTGEAQAAAEALRAELKGRADQVRKKLSRLCVCDVRMLHASLFR